MSELIHIAGEMTEGGQCCLYCPVLLVYPGPSRFAVGSMVAKEGERAFVVDRPLSDSEAFCEGVPKTISEM